MSVNHLWPESEGDILEQPIDATRRHLDVRNIPAGDNEVVLSPGLFTIKAYDGWVYYARRDTAITLDSSGNPNGADIVAPGVPQELRVFDREKWQFKVEAGGQATLVRHA